MFYFTKRDSQKNIKAIYNGRFSFVNEMSYANKVKSKKDIEEMLKRIKSEFQILDDFEIALKEELEHKSAFLKTKSGLFLTGYRYWVRVIAARLNNKRIINNYYKLRVIFYSIMYPVYETIVENDFDDKAKNLLSNSDKEVFSLFYRHTNILGRLFFLLLKRFFIWRGNRFTRNFSVIHVFEYDNKIHEFNIRENVFDIVNLAASENFNAGSIKSRIFKGLSLDSKLKNKFEFDYRWMLIKFKTEKEHWDLYKELLENKINKIKKCGFEIPADKFLNLDFYGYLVEIFAFVCSWSRLNSLELSWEILNLVLANIDGVGVKSNFDIFKYKSEKKVAKFINFFYLHGN